MHLAATRLHDLEANAGNVTNLCPVVDSHCSDGATLLRTSEAAVDNLPIALVTLLGRQLRDLVARIPKSALRRSHR